MIISYQIMQLSFHLKLDDKFVIQIPLSKKTRNSFCTRIDEMLYE